MQGNGGGRGGGLTPRPDLADNSNQAPEGMHCAFARPAYHGAWEAG